MQSTDHLLPGLAKHAVSADNICRRDRFYRSKLNKRDVQRYVNAKNNKFRNKKSPNFKKVSIFMKDMKLEKIVLCYEITLICESRDNR